MSIKVSDKGPDRRVRVILLALSILCALVPIVAVALAVDADYRRAALAHDAAISAETASQIGLTIQSVERQLETVAAVAGAIPEGEGRLRSFLRAVRSSNQDLLQVGLLARNGDPVTAPAGREVELEVGPLPTFHGTGSASYVTVSVPVGRRGDVLVAALAGSAITRRLRTLAGAPGAAGYLFTAEGRLLATSGGPSPHVSFAPLVREHPLQRVVNGRADRVIRGTVRPYGGVRLLEQLRGRTRYVTETPIRGTDWVLLLERTHRGPLSARFAIILGGAAALFACLVALLALLLVRHTWGGPVNRRLEDAVRRNEILLRETHHRVKNDLQILSSILHLSDRPGLASREHELLTESQNRVNAISLLHEMLYKTSDLAAGVSMRAYVSELIRRIESSLVGDSGAISIVTNVGDFFFDSDTSVACGLLLNELVTNSLKYAFPDGGGGVILVTMERVAAGRYLMQVQDDGVGLPEECWLADTNSLGLRLIRALTEQLCGTVSVESDSGTSWRILFDASEIAVVMAR